MLRQNLQHVWTGFFLHRMSQPVWRRSRNKWLDCQTSSACLHQLPECLRPCSRFSPDSEPLCLRQKGWQPDWRTHCSSVVAYLCLLPRQPSCCDGRGRETMVAALLFKGKTLETKRKCAASCKDSNLPSNQRPGQGSGVDSFQKPATKMETLMLLGWSHNSHYLPLS